MSRKQKKKDAREQSTRQLMGIDDITDYSIATRMGELVFFIIKPTNISVLPDAGVGARIYALLNVVKGTPHYKIKQMEQRPASEWVRVPDAHEALIARQDFELVQRIKGLDTRTSPNEDTVYLFSGILICGCCGSRMTRKTNRANGKEYHVLPVPGGCS